MLVFAQTVIIMISMHAQLAIWLNFYIGKDHVCINFISDNLQSQLMITSKITKSLMYNTSKRSGRCQLATVWWSYKIWGGQENNGYVLQN